MDKKNPTINWINDKPENKRLLLDKLTNNDLKLDLLYKWFFFCKEQGFFVKLHILTFLKDNSRSDVYWSTLYFVQKVSKTNNKYYNEKVSKILMHIIDTNCQYIIDEKEISNIFYGKECIFIDMVENLPSKKISQTHINYLIKLVGIWMLDAKLAESTFEKILQTKDDGLIFPLFEKTLTYKEMSKESFKATEPKKLIYKKNISLMDPYWLTVLLKKHFNSLIKANPLKAFNILLEVVENVKNKNNNLFSLYSISTIFTENFISPVIHPSAEEKYDRLAKEDKSTNLLSDTYLTSDLEYDGLITLLLKHSIRKLENEEDIIKIIESLTLKEGFFFTRVECYLYTKFFSNYPDKIWPYLEENNFIISNKWARHREKIKFIENNSDKFTEEQLVWILDQIKKIKWEGEGPQKQIILQEQIGYLKQLPETFLKGKKYLAKCIKDLESKNEEYKKNRKDIDIPIININTTFSEFNSADLIKELSPTNKNKLRRGSDKEDQILVEDLKLRPNFYLENFNNFLISNIKPQYLCTIINHLGTFVVENALQTKLLLKNIKSYLDKLTWAEAIKPSVYTSESLTTETESCSGYAYSYSLNDITQSLFAFLDQAFINPKKVNTKHASCIASCIEGIVLTSLEKCPTNIISCTEAAQDTPGWPINLDLISQGSRSLLMNILNITIVFVNRTLKINKSTRTKQLEGLLINKSEEADREREFSIFFGRYFSYLYSLKAKWSKQIIKKLLCEDKHSTNYLDFVFIFFNTESQVDKSIYLDFKKYKIFKSIIDCPNFPSQVNPSTDKKYEKLADPKTLSRTVEHLLVGYFSFEEQVKTSLVTYLLKNATLPAIQTVICSSYFDEKKDHPDSKVNKITYIWEEIIKRFKDSTDKDEQYALFELAPLHKYYSLSEKKQKTACFERLKYSFKAYGKNIRCEGAIFFLLDIMEKFYEQYPLEIANLWLESLNNHGYFNRYREDLLQKIFNFIQIHEKTKAEEIENKYIEAGFYFLQ